MQLLELVAVESAADELASGTVCLMHD